MFESAYPFPTAAQAIADGRWLLANYSGDAPIACKAKAAQTVISFAQGMTLPCDHQPMFAVGSELSELEAVAERLVAATGYAAPVAGGGILLTLASVLLPKLLEWLTRK